MLAQVLKKELTSPTYKYDSGLRDQNAITYVLKQEWAEHQPHVLLVNKQYCLNCYWRDLLNADLKSDDTKVRQLSWASWGLTRLSQTLSSWAGLPGHSAGELCVADHALLPDRRPLLCLISWRFSSPACEEIVQG